MKKRKVFKPNNLPTRLPLLSTVVCLLALDYWHAPQWLWGAMCFFLLLAWIGAFISIWKETYVDYFKNE